MSAQIASVRATYATPRTGPGEPSRGALYWTLILFGAVGTLLGLTGSMLMAHLQSFATVEVHGMAPFTFEKLIVGGLVLSCLGAAGLWLRGRNIATR